MMLFLGLIILVKVLATSATNGGGGVGGTFAPSLYVGCFAGFFFAYVLNHTGLLPMELSDKNCGAVLPSSADSLTSLRSHPD